jgi:hypothetical protein
VLERAIAASDRAGARVCQSLRKGVRDALAGITRAIDRASREVPRSRHGIRRDDEALTAVYRILFLLFAEARRLVPVWHPVYRDAYTLAALRSRLETRSSTRVVHGRHFRPLLAWRTRVARLATCGSRRSTAACSPPHTRRSSITCGWTIERSAPRWHRSYSWTAAAKGRRRVAYEDLGVEQLGSIYEQLLDDPPDGDGSRSRRSEK